MPRDLTKTVLVLGAGASHASALRLPVMNGFFDDTVEDFTAFAGLLKWLYPGREPSDYNLEDVLAFLDVSRTRLSIWGKRLVDFDSDSAQLYNECLRYVQRRLTIPSDTWCDQHELLFRKIGENGTILTLNYDLVADQTLRRVTPQNKHGYFPESSQIGKLKGLLAEQNLFGAFFPPSLMERERRGGFYVKLHGSIDWLVCPHEGCRNNINVFAIGLYRDVLANAQAPGAPCRVCGSALETLIVPPIASKRLKDRGKLAFLWNLALEELRCASRIAFVGISLETFDADMLWLIRQALGDARSADVSIAVVNPNDKHRGLLIRTLPGKLWRVAEYESFDVFVAQFS